MDSQKKLAKFKLKNHFFFLCRNDSIFRIKHNRVLFLLSDFLFRLYRRFVSLHQADQALVQSLHRNFIYLHVYGTEVKANEQQRGTKQQLQRPQLSQSYLTIAQSRSPQSYHCSED